MAVRPKSATMRLARSRSRSSSSHISRCAFGERNFSGEPAEQFVPDLAADAFGLEQVFQVVDFEQLERAV